VVSGINTSSTASRCTWTSCGDGDRAPSRKLATTTNMPRDESEGAVPVPPKLTSHPATDAGGRGDVLAAGWKEDAVLETVSRWPGSLLQPDLHWPRLVAEF